MVAFFIYYHELILKSYDAGEADGLSFEVVLAGLPDESLSSSDQLSGAAGTLPSMI